MFQEVEYGQESPMRPLNIFALQKNVHMRFLVFFIYKKKQKQQPKCMNFLFWRQQISETKLSGTH